MTLNSYFYDSVDGDRPYSARDFTKAFGVILQDGVVANEDGTLGFVLGGTNYTTVYSGKATVQGHFIELEGTEIITVPAGSYAGLIVLRVDITDARKVTLAVRTDQIPQQDETIWEYALYQVSVSNGIISSVPVNVRAQGGAIAVPAANVPTFFYRDNGVYLQVGTYSIALTPAQPPGSAKRVWIQIDN